MEKPAPPMLARMRALERRMTALEDRVRGRVPAAPLCACGKTAKVWVSHTAYCQDCRPESDEP